MKDLNRLGWLLAGVTGMALSASVAVAQADSTPAPQDKAVEGRIERRADFDPAVLRERLTRRLVELELETARVRNAVEQLNKGGAPEDVFELLRPTMERRVEAMPRAHGGPPEGFGPKGEEGGPAIRRGPGAPAHEGMMLRDRFNAGEPLTDEQRRALESFLAANTPRVAAQLDRLESDHPQAAEFLLRDVQRRMQELERVAKEDPAALQERLRAVSSELEIRQAAMDFVRARRAADVAAQAEARAAIEQLVPERVAATLADRERELAAMKERIARMEAELAAARADPQEMIAKRLDELLQRLEQAPVMQPRAPGEPAEPRLRRKVRDEI